LERAAQIYHQSPCDTSVKQAVENLFNGSHSNNASLNLSKRSHHALLAEGAVQIAMNHLLCKDFTIQSLLANEILIQKQVMI